MGVHQPDLVMKMSDNRLFILKLHLGIKIT